MGIMFFILNIIKISLVLYTLAFIMILIFRVTQESKWSFIFGLIYFSFFIGLGLFYKVKFLWIGFFILASLAIFLAMFLKLKKN